MSAGDDRHPPGTVARATRLRDAAAGRINDPAVLRAAREVAEAFVLRAEALSLDPLQALAAAARTAFALGAATHGLLRAKAPGDPGLADFTDLAAFRAAFAVLVDTGIEILAGAEPDGDADDDADADTDTDQETRH